METVFSSVACCCCCCTVGLKCLNQSPFSTIIGVEKLVSTTLCIHLSGRIYLVSIPLQTTKRKKDIYLL